MTCLSSLILLGCFSAALSLSCENGWVSRPGSESCYKFVLNPQKDWASAQADCQNMKAHLASLNTEEEIVWLIGYRSYHKDLRQLLWTGGYEDNGKWFWKEEGGDSVAMTATDWATGQPDIGNQHCVQLFDDVAWGGNIAHTTETRFKFDNRECSASSAYICEKPAA